MMSRAELRPAGAGGRVGFPKLPICSPGELSKPAMDVVARAGGSQWHRTAISTTQVWFCASSTILATEGRCVRSNLAPVLVREGQSR